MFRVGQKVCYKKNQHLEKYSWIPKDHPALKTLFKVVRVLEMMSKPSDSWVTIVPLTDTVALADIFRSTGLGSYVWLLQKESGYTEAGSNLESFLCPDQEVALDAEM